jgi:hypothetical protein
MNRDAILATVIGFGVGLLIMGALLLGPNLGQFLPKLNFDFLTQNQQAAPNETPQQALTIDSPLDEAIESENTVLLSGKAAPGATIVLQGAVDELVIMATQEGTWAGRVKLVEGTNTITATMYVKTEATTLTKTVYYTPEEF